LLDWSLPLERLGVHQVDDMKQRSVRPKSRLVQRPGELAADDDECDNALHYAALEGDTEQLIELLAGARFPINSVGRRRWTPLHYAANAGELTVRIIHQTDTKRV